MQMMTCRLFHSIVVQHGKNAVDLQPFLRHYYGGEDRAITRLEEWQQFWRYRLGVENLCFSNSFTVKLIVLIID